MSRRVTIKRKHAAIAAIAFATGLYFVDHSRSFESPSVKEVISEDEGASLRTIEGRIVKVEDAPVYTGESNIRKDGDKRTVNLKMQYLTVQKCNGVSCILLNQLNPAYLNLDAEIKYRTFKPDEFKIDAMNSYSRLIEEYIRMGYITNDGKPVRDISGLVLPGGIKYR